MILTGEGEIKVEFWTGSRREYEIRAFTDLIVVEPTMNYLGWITNDLTHQKQLEYLDDPEIGGRIAYALPAGDYLIKSQFTQNTWARRLGNLISLGALICLFLYSCSHLIMKKGLND